MLDSFMNIDAALQSPLITTHLIRFDFPVPIDNVMQDTGSHWLDLCLTPRLGNARASYRDRWSPQRFEPLGNLYMIPSGQTFHARGDMGGHTAIICLLRSERVGLRFGSAWEWTEQRLKASLNIRSANIRNLVLRLGEEARHPGFASEAFAEAIAEQLVIELVRYYSAPEEDAISGGLSGWRLRRIDERIMEVAQPPSLSELAELCNLSVRQLTRAFRESRGCSVGQYIADQRIEKAKRLLEGDESIKSIAYSMAFATPAAFCYAFRSATSQTPGEYRTHLRAFSGRRGST